jgi:hypothetical protein
MAATEQATRLTPYLEELLENSYVRENIREGVENLRSAYERSQKRRVKTARDQRLRRQVRAAAASMSEAAQALQSGRRKPKPRWGRRLLLLGGVAAVGIGIAIAAGGEDQASQA